MLLSNLKKTILIFFLFPAMSKVEFINTIGINCIFSNMPVHRPVVKQEILVKAHQDFWMIYIILQII